VFFSRARRGYGFGFPPSLRDGSVSGIWGLAGLTPEEQERFRIGNALASWAADLIHMCIKPRVPVVIENPQTSRLWLFPSLAALLSTASCDGIVHFCQFEVLWKKPTCLVGWHVNFDSVLMKCSGSACSKTGHPNQLLVGVDEKGEFWTAKASAHTFRFCRAMVDCYENPMAPC
jgi:hypothetical protein